MILKYIVTGDLRMLTTWAKRVAMSIDVFANIHGSQIFNDVLNLHTYHVFAQYNCMVCLRNLNRLEEANDRLKKIKLL